jgi:hypothetical protein
MADAVQMLHWSCGTCSSGATMLYGSKLQLALASYVAQANALTLSAGRRECHITTRGSQAHHKHNNISYRCHIIVVPVLGVLVFRTSNGYSYERVCTDHVKLDQGNGRRISRRVQARKKSQRGTGRIFEFAQTCTGSHVATLAESVIRHAVLNSHAPSRPAPASRYIQSGDVLRSTQA